MGCGPEDDDDDGLTSKSALGISPKRVLSYGVVVTGLLEVPGVPGTIAVSFPCSIFVFSIKLHWHGPFSDIGMHTVVPVQHREVPGI